MRVLIVEDEIPTRRMLEKKIKELRPEWQVAGQTGSVEETVEWLDSHPLPHLIFMDIQLSDGVCFNIFEQTQVHSMVIFTTAYDEYAIQAFSVNSIDYLLKPIQTIKLEEAMSKFERFQRHQPDPARALIDYNQLAEALAGKKKNYRSRFLINTADGFNLLNVNDIARFESANKIVSAITFQQQHNILDLSLDKLEKELDPELFFRANRQFIVNIHSIKKVENWFNGKLIIKSRPATDEKLVVSRERARGFKEWVNR